MICDSLPNDSIVDSSRFKALEDEKLDMTQKLKFALGRVENILFKGENAGYQHFLLFPQYFQEAIFSRSLKELIGFDYGSNHRGGLVVKASAS